MKWRTTIGIAFAAAIVAAAGVYVYSAFSAPDPGDSGEVRVFKSYSQIERTLNRIQEEEPMVYANGGGMSTIVEDAEAPGGMDQQAAAHGGAERPAAAKGKEHSETYIQVEGVDEADIIKTDGNYIYYTSRLGYDVVIAKADGDQVKEAALIPEEETGVSADDLFLTGGRLIIIGSAFEGEESVDYNHYGVSPGEVATTACIYDVTRPEKPKLIGKYKQSGSYVSARVTDGYLYLITNDYLGGVRSRIVPSAGADDAYDKLEPDHICCFPEPARKAYAVIGSVKTDSAKGKIKSDTRAVLGTSDDIYCSNNAIYMTDFTISFRDFREGGADEHTNIIKAEIGKGKIDFAKQGSVRGTVNNQFSMDEKDGYFRIAVTAFVKGKDVNYLYVLDQDLKVVGKVKGFAGGEQIKAVRFLGDMAYVITYEQTDPLFVIDLHDPEAPQLLGSVKITGFSSLLVPEGENMLVGIGSSTSEEEFGEVEDGVKIALFDISDPMKPEVLDSKTYKNLGSDVQYDHRALVANSKDGWYAIPYSDWEKENGGVLRFAVEGKKLKELDNFNCEQGIGRCLYIEDQMYGLAANEDKLFTWAIGQDAEK